MNKSYQARLIRDLAVTFNFTPLTVTDIARYWKRSKADVAKIAGYLAQREVIKFDKNLNMSFTSSYRKFFNNNPDVALQLAKQGL